MAVSLRGRQDARAGRKRSRYSRGLTPARRANARRRVSTVPNPAGAGDVVDRKARRLQQALRDLDADALSTYAAGVTPTSSRNTRAKWRGLMRDAFGELLDRAVGVGMLDDPRLQLADRIALRDLRAELRAELRLPAGPLHEHDELARDASARRHGRGLRSRARVRGPCPRSRRPTSTRRRRARRSDRARPSTLGIPAREELAGLPVRRRALAVEQPGRREQERARAHGRDPPAPRRPRVRPVARARVARRVDRAVPTDDDQRVDRAAHAIASARSATIVGPAAGRDRPGLRAATIVMS